MTVRTPELCQRLCDLDLSQVAITAALARNGMLINVGGVSVKTNAAWRVSRVGSTRFLLTAADQPETKDLDGKPLGEDELSTITVLTGATLEELVLKLHRRQGPAAAIRRWEADQFPRMELLNQAVEWEGHYQELKVFFRIPPERLPKDQSRRRGKDQEDDRAGAGENGRPTVTIQRWEEQVLRREERLAPPVTLDNVFSLRYRQIVDKAAATVPRLVFLGPPGTGKTTLIQYLLRRMRDGVWPNLGRALVPAYVRLREWHSREDLRNLDLVGYLVKRHAHLMPGQDGQQREEQCRKSWRTWLARGDVLLLLDGLDEIPPGGTVAEALKRALNEYSAPSGPHPCPSVLTCRTVSFEQYQAICPGFDLFVLGPIEGEARRRFIINFPERRFDADELTRELARLPQMEPLASNPLLLAIVCWVVNDPSHPRGRIELPATRGELYDRAIDRFLGQPPRVFIDNANVRALNADSKRRLLEKVAFRLFADHQGQLTYTSGELRPVVREAAQVSEGLDVDALIDGLLADLTQNSGILRTDGMSYFYLHRSVQDFLAASALAELVNGPGGWKSKITIRDKQRAIDKKRSVLEFVDKKAWDPRWQEVICLLAGRLQNPARLLKMLSNSRRSRRNRFGDDISRHRLVLGALCLPEISCELRSGQSALMDEITHSALSLWWELKEHERDGREDLTRLGPVLGLVNGRVWLDPPSGDLAMLVEQIWPRFLLPLRRRWQAGGSFLHRLIHLLCAPDPDTRHQAEEAVAWVGSAAATADFLGHIADLFRNSDEHVRFAAARAVCHLGSRAATPEFLARLAELLRDPVDHVRSAAGSALGRLGTARATPEFVAVLCELLADTKKEVRAAAAQALGEVTNAAAIPQVLARLADLLRDPEMSVRHAAATAVGRSGSAVATPQILGGLADLFRDPELGVWIAAAKATARLASVAPTVDSLALLGDILGQGDALGYAAASALGQLRPGAATPEFLARLVGLLGGTEWGFRHVAVTAVGRLGSGVATAEILALVGRLLRDPDMHVRASAAEAVGRLGSAIATAELCAGLGELLRDQDSYVVCTAARAVGELGSAGATTEILACLADLLRHQEHRVRYEAAHAVGELGSAAATAEILARLAELFCNWKWDVNIAAAEAVGKLGKAAATADILARLTDKLRSPRWEFWLEDLLHARPARTWSAAAKALGRLIGQEVRFFKGPFGKRRWKTVTELSD
jgi:HEAT repeat protein